MNLQQRLLRAMLWMLGLAAAGGVLTIFTSPRVTGRLAGTAFLAAVSIALAMAAARPIEDEKRRLGSVVSLGGIVLGFVLALAAIWSDLVTRGWFDEFRLAFTGILCWFGGFAAGSLLMAAHHPFFRVAARAGLITVLVAFVLAVLGIWWNRFDDKLGQSAGLALLTGGAASVALIGVGTNPYHWRWIGVLAAGAALALGVLGIWVLPPSDPSHFVLASSIAVVTAYAVAVLAVPLAPSANWIRWAAVLSTAATAAGIVSMTYILGGFDGPSPPELLGRGTAAAGIVAACSTLALAVMYRLNRRPTGRAQADGSIAEIQVICPHCDKKQAVPLDGGACARCGMIFVVKVFEPRCTNCEYSLLDLRSDRCPECGTPRGTAIPQPSGPPE